MDGESVTDDPSLQYKTFTEVFIKLCPYYMEMGMSYYDFWHMNTSCHKAYRQAYEIRRRNEEWARWRQGAYVFNAILSAAPVIKPFVKDPKPGKYPEEPWPLTQEEADRQEAEKERKGYEMALARRKAEIQRRKELEVEASENGRD